MRYRIAFGLAVAAIQLALTIPVASAQDMSSLDNFSLGAAQPPAQARRPQTLDKIVAVVNGGVILNSELDAQVARVRQQSGSHADQLPPNVLRSQVLDHMIMQRLQIERAKQDHIQVSKQDIQQGLARIARQNNMNMQQLSQAVASSGMSMDELRQQIRRQIMISKLRRKEVMSKVVVTNADINHYLENQSLRDAGNRQYHLRQIVVRLPANATDAATQAAHQQAESLRQRIEDGKADFASVARARSQGPHANAGGDLGWVKASSLPDQYLAVLSTMHAGDISPVFRGPDGLYLIQIEGQRGGSGSDSGRKVMVQEAKLRHILLKPNAIRNDARTHKLAQQLRERLRAGDSFAALARNYSDDSATANQGGDLGWVRISRLDPGTQRQIDNLQKGQISPVFHTPSGYEIVKLEARRKRDETAQARRDKIRQKLGRQRSNEQGQLWLRKLRDEAYVDIRMPDYQPTPNQ